MKKLILFIIVLGCTKLNAQINEIGVFLGGSNFIGDVGKTNYIAPRKTPISLIWAFSLVKPNIIINKISFFIN